MVPKERTSSTASPVAHDLASRRPRGPKGSHREGAGCESPAPRAQRPRKASPLLLNGLTTTTTGGGSGLVDLLVARRRVRGVHLYRRADLLELEVVGLRTVLDDVGQVLGVAGVTDTLNARALGGVVASLGDVERLVELTALGILLAFLGDRRAAVTTAAVVALVLAVLAVVAVAVVAALVREGGESGRQQDELPHAVPPCGRFLLRLS